MKIGRTIFFEVLGFIPFIIIFYLITSYIFKSSLLVILSILLFFFFLSIIHMEKMVKRDESYHLLLFKGFSLPGKSLGIFIQNVCLTAVYIVLCIVAFVGKVTGKKFLAISEKNEKTYWKDLNLGKEKEETYFRQF